MKQELINNVITHSSKELKELIDAYPDYPLVVVVNNESPDDYSGSVACKFECSISYFLDCETPFEEVFDDEDSFREKLEDWLYNETEDDMTDEEFQAMVEAELKKYEPYWKECIEIYIES